MLKIFNSILSGGKKIGIDKSIAYSSGARIIQTFTGIILLFFIARYLTKAEQGFYYTFGSIVAIQVFFELGLTNIITQYVAHEASHLKWKDTTTLEGEEKNHSRLAHLLRFSVRWYAIISGIFFIVLLGVGIWFFGYYSTPLEDETVSWFIPWCLVSIGASIHLFISPLMATIQGLNRVKDVMKMRFYQQLIIPFTTLIGLMIGWHLYVVGIASILSAIYVFVYASCTDLKLIIVKLWRKEITEKIIYKKEIFPYQWKIALSWLSGYFIFQLFNPVLFATHGAVVAGQMGMTIQVLNAINAFSMSWISTKIPVFSGLIAQEEYKKLDKIFNTTVKQMSAVCVMLLGIMILGVSTLRWLDIPLGYRFLPYWPMIFMSLALFLNQYVGAWATYLRCHKKEPYLWLSVVTGLACTGSTIVLGKFYGAFGMSAGYCFIVILSVFLAYSIYTKCKISWHSI